MESEDFGKGSKIPTTKPVGLRPTDFGQTIGRRYQVLSKLGEGKFGVVYQGRNIVNEQSVAIKTESVHSPIRLIKNETAVLKYLYDQGCRCCPIVYWYGLHYDTTCLVFSYYKISLHDYLHIGPINDSKKNAIMRTCIGMMESIHKHFVIHRDIKPQNFMIRDGELFLIDFGLSTFYIDSAGNPIENVMSENLTGTPKYVSYNVHDGHTASRRDDMISLGYMFLWITNGSLWQLEEDTLADGFATTHISHPTNVYFKKRKSWPMLEDLVSNSNKEFGGIYRYLEHCYRLDYEGSPLYGELEKLFG
jgi:serine/threonine protein kinase